MVVGRGRAGEAERAREDGGVSGGHYRRLIHRAVLMEGAEIESWDHGKHIKIRLKDCVGLLVLSTTPEAEPSLAVLRSRVRRLRRLGDGKSS